jgi:hypothetical protein
MRQKYDEGQRVEAEKRNKEGYKHKGKLEKEYKEIMGEERKMNSGKDALFALTPTDAGATFVKGLKKKGINVQKIRDDILKEKMKSKEFRIGIAKGKTKASDDNDKKYRVYKKGGKASKMPVARDKNKPSAHSMDKKAVMLKSGGRTGYSVGGRAMRGVSKILIKK